MHGGCILDIPVMCFTNSLMDNMCIRSISCIHKNNIRIEAIQRIIPCIMHFLFLSNLTNTKKACTANE